MSIQLLLTVLSGKEKHMNINKFAGLFRDRVGGTGCLNFVHVFFLFHSLWGRKTHKQSPPQKSRGNPVKNSVYVFFCLCVFFAPRVLVFWFVRCWRPAPELRPGAQDCTPRASICFMALSSRFLDQLPLVPRPPMQNRTNTATEEVLLQQKGAQT